MALGISTDGATKRNFNDTAKRCLSLCVGFSAHALAKCTLHVVHAAGCDGTISFVLVGCRGKITRTVDRPMSSAYCHASYAVALAIGRKGLATRTSAAAPLPTPMASPGLGLSMSLRTSVTSGAFKNAKVRRANDYNRDAAVLRCVGIR